jgi:ribonucleoside-triphosphate reductase
MLSFNLDADFVAAYRQKASPFPNALAQITYFRTYARKIDDNRLEDWVDTCERVINGMYSIQKDYCFEHGRKWSDTKAVRSAQEAFDRLFNLKWTPPGRGLTHMGVEEIHSRETYTAFQNCAFISTAALPQYGGKIFYWIMEMLMLGVGVGFDSRGAGSVFIDSPGDPYGDDNDYLYSETFLIPDTREGWADAVSNLVNSYIRINDYVPHADEDNRYPIKFDYSLIRAAGEPIRGFGGVSSGPEPLKKMLEDIRVVLEANHGSLITTRTINDIANMIGVCVVSGNVRRSAEISLGDPDDDDFLNLKNYEKNPERAAHGWSSNNSIFAKVGQDYDKYIDNVLTNGEPGFIWMENAQRFGRMGETSIDRATGTNPCSEQFLEGYSDAGLGGECCTLAEIHMSRHDDFEDFTRSIKFAYLYTKSITLLSDKIRHAGTREIMMRNRRIGLGVTGTAQFISSHSISNLVEWLDDGYSFVRHYDKFYSSWLDVPESVRVTTSKPSGSVSLLSGSTPGVHYPHSEYYIRRIRLAENSHLVQRLKYAGIYVEPDDYSANTVVASIPIHAGTNIRRSKDLTIWEQLELAAIVQRYWSDNGVSVTVTVDPSKIGREEFKRAIEMYQYKLKAVSFLPEIDGGAYSQMPYEEISKDVYDAMESLIDYTRLEGLNMLDLSDAKMIDAYCDGIACAVEPVRR